MPFAAGLRDSMRVREQQVSSEFEEGYSLERVLDGHLLTVEQSAESELITSVLLLGPDGDQLFHGAGPNLPSSYRAEIDGSSIGPTAGSCGTAAYLGQPIYVTDIATDPLWDDYRHLALPHNLRSCWSTPIRKPDGSVLGTFAIYHRTVGGPTPDEIEAIDMITRHVAAAIIWGRVAQDLAGPSKRQSGDQPPKLVRGATTPVASDHHSFDRLLLQIKRLEAKAGELDHGANDARSEDERRAINTVADDCRRLVSAIRLQLDQRKLGNSSAP